MYRRHTNTLRPYCPPHLPPDFARDAAGFLVSVSGGACGKVLWKGLDERVKCCNFAAENRKSKIFSFFCFAKSKKMYFCEIETL